MRKYMASLLFLLALFVLSACGAPTDPTTEKESAETEHTAVTSNQTSKEVSQASSEKTEEGTFTLYTSQPEEDIAKLIQAFNEKYPDIQVKVFRSGTEEVISKVLAEKETGKIQADALLVSDSFTFDKLAQEDLLQAYASKELSQIPEAYVDKNHLYTGTKVIVTGLAVNTDLVKAEEITSFADLTKESVKGKIMIPSPLYSGAASLNLSILTQQETIGWKFYEGLKANEVFVGKGNGTVRDALINGQQGVGMLVDYMANRAAQDGAPITFVYPKEGALYVTEPIGILKGAANAQAAEKFVDFILSEEGQTATAKMGYTPVRKGVPAPEGLKAVQDIQPLPFDAAKVLETRDADKEQFADLFGLE